jgi:hypothetical protein
MYIRKARGHGGASKGPLRRKYAHAVEAGVCVMMLHYWLSTR